MAKNKPFTLKQLQRGIAQEKKKLAKAQAIEAKIIERSKLKQELFQLKHRKAIAGARKVDRL